MTPARALHVDLDGAWPRDALADYLDCREWGPRLRYSTTRKTVREFFAAVQDRLAPFTLYGSGDFHFLTALWLRKIERPFTLISFDNHPDWDARPPRWCCGTWINRALELPALRHVAVWGCGNFELNWPNRLFRNQRAEREGRLTVAPWAGRIAPSARKLWPGITPENWQDHFSKFAASLAGGDVYVTVDLDCLREGESVTNWEAGHFRAADIEWALGTLRAQAEIIGGDVCGAWSPPQYARWKQRIESSLDHPRMPAPDPREASQVNARTFETVWPALTGGHQHDPRRNQAHADP